MALRYWQRFWDESAASVVAGSDAPPMVNSHRQAIRAQCKAYFRAREQLGESQSASRVLHRGENEECQRAVYGSRSKRNAGANKSS